MKTLGEVLSRSCHFLATPSLETQALALACMRDCVVKLASAGADAGEAWMLFYCCSGGDGGVVWGGHVDGVGGVVGVVGAVLVVVV